MKHPILGEIERTNGGVIDAVAKIRHGSRNIEIQIIRDDQTFDITVQLAAEVVGRLDELDRAAKRVATANLRQTYNSGWNEYDEAQADGTLMTVSNPQLSEAEFENKLTLKAINVTGDRMIHFFYDDEKMFWGHSVVVCSLNGVDFGEAYAELFG